MRKQDFRKKFSPESMKGPWKCWICILWIFGTVRSPLLQNPAALYIWLSRNQLDQKTPLKISSVIWPKAIVDGNHRWKGQLSWSHPQHWSAPKEGAQALFASYVAAAEGHYQLKSFTEEEDMKELLLWKLGGNKVTQINHHANCAPSISHLQTHLTVSAIIPSHKSPTI